VLSAGAVCAGGHLVSGGEHRSEAARRGLVWLYFLLAGGVYRKRALQALLTAVALSLPGVLWSGISRRAGYRNCTSISWRFRPTAHQRPRASSMGPRACWICKRSSASSGTTRDLQSGQLSHLWAAPARMIFVTVRSRPSRARVWLALAAISALSMLLSIIASMTPNSCCSRFPPAPCSGRGRQDRTARAAGECRRPCGDGRFGLGIFRRPHSSLHLPRRGCPGRSCWLR